MLYSSAVLFVVKEVKGFLESAGSTSTLSARKVETSDPSELDEKHLVTELGLAGSDAPTVVGGGPADNGEKKPFARPRGPAKKAR